MSTSVAFSPDGKTIAAGYDGVGGGVGGGVVLWDVAARKRLADDPLPVKEGDVRGVAFSPDGKTIAAGYGGRVGGGVVLWDVDLESWQRIAGRIANRNFTRDEWRQYFPEEPYRRDLPRPARSAGSVSEPCQLTGGPVEVTWRCRGTHPVGCVKGQICENDTRKQALLSGLVL